MPGEAESVNQFLNHPMRKALAVPRPAPDTTPDDNLTSLPSSPTRRGSSAVAPCVAEKGAVDSAALSRVEAVIADALGRVFSAAVLFVSRSGSTVLHRAYGFLDPETSRQPAQLDTLFDLASVTKLFTTTAFMRLVEAGKVALDQPVATVLPAFRGLRPIQPYEDPLHPGQEVAVVPQTDEKVDAGWVTFRHLLTHTSGLPAWSPLFRLGSRQAAIEAVLASPFSYPPGTRVVYSDLGFILLGEAISHLTGQPLDAALGRLVLEPLGLKATGFRPLAGTTCRPTATIAATEFCAWRGRRLVGEVHDENAARLEGVAGHAGLFSTAEELARLGEMYLWLSLAGRESARAQRESAIPMLLRPDTMAEMTRLQAEDGVTRRGLGFALWSPDPEASGHPFGPLAFGHTGFTGTSLWMDPQRELLVACLTNRVYYGRDPQEITAFRVALHQAAVAASEGQR